MGPLYIEIACINNLISLQGNYLLNLVWYKARDRKIFKN